LVDENYLTSLAKVYACGDAVTGAKTIGEAVLGGTKCAESIITKYKKSD
jgi:NADPH-dependent glutamate synthase beta subunit-like oxidoreductase